MKLGNWVPILLLLMLAGLLLPSFDRVRFKDTALIYNPVTTRYRLYQFVDTGTDSVFLLLLQFHIICHTGQVPRETCFLIGSSGRGMSQVSTGKHPDKPYPSGFHFFQKLSVKQPGNAVPR